MSWTLRNIQYLNILKKVMLTDCTKTNFHKYRNKNIYINILPSNFQKSQIYSNLEILRYKHNKKSKKQDDLSESDEEDTDEWNDEIIDKHTKLLNVKVNSLRADVILKAGLGIARNKIETMFYESRIRTNGKKLMKKSELLSEGDEVDIVKGTNVANPNFLTVSRVELLSAIERGEGFTVKLRRSKSLTIENYSGENAWKG